MKQRVLAGLAMAALLAGAVPASSEEPNDLARRMLGYVVEHLDNFFCGEAKCTPATAEELAKPPIADADADLIVERGVLSAFGEHCGLDWQRRNFEPLMAYWRHDRKRPVREMAMIGGLHGVAQGVYQKAARDQGACTPELKATVDASLDFKPKAAT